MVCAVQCGASWFMLYSVELHGLCCTVWSFMVCAVQCGASWFVLYSVALHGLCCTVWRFMVCAVQCGASWFVLYSVDLHGLCCTVWSFMVCAVLCGSSWFVLYCVELHGLCCSVELHGLCCTVWSFMVCAVQCGASGFVLYSVELHGLCCTVWRFMVCAVQCGASWFVLYSVALHDLFSLHINAALLPTCRAVRAVEAICQYRGTVSGRDSKPRSNPSFELQQKTLICSFLSSKFHTPCTVKRTRWPTNQPTNRAHSVQRASTPPEQPRAAQSSDKQTQCTYRQFTGHTNKTGISDEKRIKEQSRLCTYNVTVWRVRVTILSWKHNSELCVVEVHGTANCTQIVLHNSAVMVNVCHRQQCRI